MGQDLILDQVFGQLASTFIAYFIIRKIEFYKRSV
jgi:hypothetical protein